MACHIILNRFYVMNWKAKAFLSRLMREKDLTNKCTYTIACVRWVTIGRIQERFHCHNKLPKVTKVKMHLMFCFHSWKKKKNCILERLHWRLSWWYPTDGWLHGRVHFFFFFLKNMLTLSQHTDFCTERCWWDGLHSA